MRAAWTRVFGLQSWQRDLPFEQAGGDSLKALELWLHLEQALGRKLALDALAPGSRPSDLAQALSCAIRPDAGGPQAMDRGRPLVYLLPGILGDDPLQLRFRQAFGGEVNFRVLDYPAWPTLTQSDCSLDVIVDAVFAQLMADPSLPSYALAGYSFGGIVAYELARRLLAAGRKVAMVTLLDSRRWDLVRSRPVWQWDGTLPLRARVNKLASGVVTLMVRNRLYGLLGLASTALSKKGGRMAFRLRNRMTKDLRFEAVRKWRPFYLPVPMTLYLSGSRWPGEPQSYGWQDLTASLEVVYVGGTHDTVIDQPGRDRIVLHMQRALEAKGALAA